MFDPLRKLMLRIGPMWDKRSTLRKIERYAVILLYIIMAVLFAMIMLRA